VKKVIVIVVALCVLGGLAFPVANLVAGLPKGTALTKDAKWDGAHAAVGRILEAKCGHCHVPGTPRPFYAALPVAGGLIEADVTQGLRQFDLADEIVRTPPGPPSQAAVAKISHEVRKGQMPPVRYVALHWDASLGSADRAAIDAWVRDLRVNTFAPKGLPAEVAARGVHPVPAKVDVDAARADLGRRLYDDKRLSGDDTLSCASCHDLAKGGTDQAKVSTGIRGQKGGINAPTTFNALWQVRQFWDGRASDLQDQAGGPPLNPIEMGATWEGIVGKLAADAPFAEAFAKSYPEGLSSKTITHAIAEFEKTLVTPDCPFDRFLAGKADAIDARAARGWQLFQDHGCDTCHAGVLLGGTSFERMGHRRDYFGERGSPLTDADQGRIAVTKKESDRGRFKVPTLRNVARTFPYFHDGTAADLPAAVKSMARYQTGLDALPADDADAIAKFLESLTGTWQGRPL
jgi:cytochrome c peroxidase